MNKAGVHRKKRDSFVVYEVESALENCFCLYHWVHYMMFIKQSYYKWLLTIFIFFFHFLGFQLADSYITRMLSIYRCICRWWGLSSEQMKCRKGAYLLKNYIRTISVVHPKLVFYFGINDSKLVCPACKEGLIVPPFLKVTLKNKSLIPVPHSSITRMSIIGQWGNK